MRARWLIVLSVVAMSLVGYATLKALADNGSSRAGTTVDVTALRPGRALPIDVELPGPKHTNARVFVVRPRGRPVMALLGISTHLGCRLLARGDSTFGEGFTRQGEVAFEDPCGGSTFALDGRCVGGPCPRGLDRYEVTVADETATFDLHKLVVGPPRGS